ncbi:hypothetical protein RND71_007825 [Anisodus tanguticus]|uniref:Uncharacterized protein n=1 Tax=Anisodus tanguticus TaxID=243964 RepID=A0AAE1SPN9_9SOLA|nr:hypothetical protein RND71_007825 [Anisodus tanguticus]
MPATPLRPPSVHSPPPPSPDSTQPCSSPSPPATASGSLQQPLAVFFFFAGIIRMRLRLAANNVFRRVNKFYQPGQVNLQRYFRNLKHSSASVEALASFQFQRFKSTEGLLFKVHNDDNDSSELGSPVERAIGQLKLVTEKPDHFLKLDNGRKVSSHKSRSESKQRNNGRILTLVKPHQSEFGIGDDASGSTYTASDVASTNGRRSISVGNSLERSALLQSGVCLMGLTVGKSLESCNRAIRAGALTVGSSRLPIHPLGASTVVTIRIEDIPKDASFGEIHSICKSVGTTEGLAWVSKDGVDALFMVENDTESELILKKLNGTVVGGHCLSASLLPNHSSSASMSENEDARCKMALQINSYLTELKRQVNKKKEHMEEYQVLKVHMEDLQMLHEGIMRLEDLPSIIDTSDI